MKFVVYGMGITLARRMRTLRGWLSLLLIPALVLGRYWVLPAGDMTAPVQVGVCLPESGAEAFWELLEGHSGTVLTFLAASEGEIEARVASGQWDCGVILPEDFGTRLETLKTKGLFTLITGPNSAVYPLVRETVSATMAQLVSPALALEYVREIGLGDALPEEALKNRVLEESERVLLHMTTPDGSPLAPLKLADSGIRQLLCWLTSCLILIWMLLSATELGTWLQSPGAGRMAPLQSKTYRMLTRIGPEALMGAISGRLTLLVLGYGPMAATAAWAYTLFWMSAALLLGRIPKISGGLPVWIPFAGVASLLGSGLLISRVEWMPVGWFLAGCEGDFRALVALAAATALCLGMAFGLEKAR